MAGGAFAVQMLVADASERRYSGMLCALFAFYYRFFDIVKPLGIRRMEDLPGGVGVMMDDVLAGVYSAVILLAINFIIR